MNFLLAFIICGLVAYMILGCQTSPYKSWFVFGAALLGLGNAFECISDPIPCLNQPQKYSMYVHENKFDENIKRII